MKVMNNGSFVISLDFELLWGVRDKRSIESYGDNIKNVHQIIPRLLDLFSKYEISATFSTVGFIFMKNKKELLENYPATLPNYANVLLSPYSNHIQSIDDNGSEDIYHFAPDLINEIKKHSNHEIGTHTFSHYYCLESGQTLDEFRADISKAVQVAERVQIEITSIIFPRNQYSDLYLNACAELGIKCYRGNEESWLYKAKSGENETKIRRIFRLADAYVNLSGYNCYPYSEISNFFPINIPSSRLLRPYSDKLNFLDNLKQKRITKAMTYAAKNNQVFHLWWHPHNFGNNQNENFQFLEKILIHYKKLNESFNFKSFTMSNLASEISNG